VIYRQEGVDSNDHAEDDVAKQAAKGYGPWQKFHTLKASHLVILYVASGEKARRLALARSDISCVRLAFSTQATYRCTGLIKRSTFAFVSHASMKYCLSWINQTLIRSRAKIMSHV
jgi:hypothetical protein